MDRTRSRRLILAAVLAGLALRLVFGFFYWTGRPLTHDEREYLALAEGLSTGLGLRYPPGHDTGTSPQFGRAPGYPAFLAAIGAGERVEHAPRLVQGVQALLGALTIWLLATIARRSAGERTAVVTASIAAVYPPLVWISAYVLSESLFMPLALGCVLLLHAGQTEAADARSARGGTAWTIAAGLLAGAAILVRPGMLSFLPFAALWLVRRRHWPHALAFCVAAAAVVAPWTVRNAREYGRFVPVATEGGVTFWTGNHPLAIGEGDLAANPAIKREEIAFRQAHPGLSHAELEPLYYRDALSHIASRPGWWLQLVARKAFYTVVPVGPSYTLHSTRYRVASVLPYALLAPLAFIGLFRLLRRGGAAIPLLLLALSVVVTGLVFFPQERFRIPVLDPTVIVCASVVIAGGVRRHP